ncbi:MAG: triose-phosphate isomerase [Pseudomonadota bacterium]|jgi:triosephosphate isomerase|nr:triose-phosphate isomerase [Burkholderiales bacterium]
MNKLIVANWKMNGGVVHLQQTLNALMTTTITQNCDVVLALPTLYISQAAELFTANNTSIKIAAQDLSRFDAFGPYTGEISATMLAEFMVEYVLIGHSERRTLFNETAAVLQAKLNNALKNKLKIIYCVGEDLSIRQAGKYKEFIVEQLELLTKLSALNEIVIAYEPIWSIGTGLIPSGEEIAEIMDLIYAFVQNNLIHVKITALYGGSVNENNAYSILNIAHVGGVLVGGASLKAQEFANICNKHFIK